MDENTLYIKTDYFFKIEKTQSRGIYNRLNEERIALSSQHGAHGVDCRVAERRQRASISIDDAMRFFF